MEVNMNKLSITNFKTLIYKKNYKENHKEKSTKESNKARSIGSIAEDIACDYLKKQKLELIEKNYLCKQGEIDLIMQDQHYLVFIEVRYRKTIAFGTPLETISKHKLKRIQTAINHYTMKNNLGYIPCRVDVVGLHGKLMQPDINWVKNIFTN